MPDRYKNDYLDRMDPLGILFNPTEEQIRRRQESLYLATHLDKVKRNYALYLYEQMQQQDPGFKERINKIPPPVDTCELIMEYIVFCGDFNNGIFVLFNPETNEPCVVEDAYDFLPGKTYTGYARQMLTYKVEREEEDLLSITSLVEKGVVKGARFGTFYTLGLAEKYATYTGNYLQALSDYYADTPGRNQRINQLTRGNQRSKTKAKAELTRKSIQYSKSAQKYVLAGKTLGMLVKYGKVGWGAFANVTDVAISTTDFGNLQSIKINVETALIQYCKNNNNYDWLIKQYYFEQF